MAEQAGLAGAEAGFWAAMIGDEVNDILAMRAADCSIAMASGSKLRRLESPHGTPFSQM